MKDPDDASALAASRTTGLGLAFAIGAFLIWGVFPIFFKQLDTVPALEVLAHRVVWSTCFTAGLLTILGRWRAVVIGLRNLRLFLSLVLSAFVISLNWGVFIWAVANSRVLESSLGYYINPLVSVFLGVLVLRERLRVAQWAAVALAGVGIAHEVVRLEEMPWVALTLACSFAAYGLIRKTADVDPLTGLFVETAIMTPLALAYLLLAPVNAAGVLWQTADARTLFLLVMAGALTTLPLLLFVGAAKRIRLSTLGLLQYIVPTGHFLIAVYLYGEALSPWRIMTFVCIWIALVIYSLPALRGRHRSLA